METITGNTFFLTMFQPVVSPGPYVQLIVALLQQQLCGFELSATNQMEEGSYDAIALMELEQRELGSLAGGNH